MLARRFALAIGLLLAVVTSQLPEFVQQYRQRLGGTIDELRRTIAEFDAEAGARALSRDQGIQRLKANPDALAQARGTDLAEAVDRERRLSTQDRDFATAGPVSRYWIFIERLDPRLAQQTYAIFQPAVPVTPSGFVAAAAGFLFGWSGMRVAASPFRRRRRTATA